MSDYEAQFLALCQAHEGLRRECPCLHREKGGGCINCAGLTLLHLGRCYSECICHGTGWLPLPEAERLGALVRAAGEGSVWRECDENGVYWLACLGGMARGFAGPTPEAALTAALTAAREKQSDAEEKL